MYLTAKAPFRPGASVTVRLKSGDEAKTSVGRIHLAPYRVSVDRRLLANVGDHEDHCRRVRGNDDENWICSGDVAHIVFSAPVVKDELVRHVHPALRPATTGDLRGHRFEIALGDKPVTIVLDPKLADVFAQELKYPVRFVIRKAADE